MPKEIKDPKYGFVTTVYTIDDLIENLTELREKHGGDVVVACHNDSDDTDHPLDDLFRFRSGSGIWGRAFEPLGVDAVVAAWINP
ncbi:hypothetical protein [Micromonospora sp. NBC_01813]|uniref:hypothetical protein n=1 Tax=Micromonospora sp. NBC_01813 TaxID=2975988 RepID=UPI002DD8E76B|nr:hypothetical protein [Micromonospora sp. NBC_01813]WSA11520.1 hypothetical protein OG958_12480 [Micromonospora sp. NBC_01813]